MPPYLSKHTDKGQKADTLPVNRWIIIAGVVLLMALSTLSSVDRHAADNYDSLFQRAFVTFALARTLNGVISAVQGTEVALTPAGVGVTLTPGQVLDPVNDLIERFSWIMLGATVSLGVQQVLLDIGQWWPVKILVVFLGGVWLWLRLTRHQKATTRRIVLQAFIVLLFVRFAVPVALITNEKLFALFLEPRYEQSTQIIEAAGADIEKAGTEPLDEGAKTELEDSSLMESIQRAMDSTRESMDIKNRVNTIKERASELIEHIIQLSVVFVLQTAILPVAFLWLFLQCLKFQIISNHLSFNILYYINHIILSPSFYLNVF